MQPQAIGHSRSAHARVACVQCHVQDGFGHHMQAKLAGVSRVLAVALDSHRGAIRSSAGHANEINTQCRSCHRLERTPPFKLKRIRYTQSEGLTTPEELAVILKLGSGRASAGGAHWHSDHRIRVAYAAVDPLGQQIPWVKVRRADGTEITYSSSIAAGPEQWDQVPKHEMDCVDCHNRVGHAIAPQDSRLESSYPDNQGHWLWPGCFRCHDGRHVAPDGTTLPSDCGQTCHTLPQREPPPPDAGRSAAPPKEWHPWPSPAKVFEIPPHQQLICSDCHRAGDRPRHTCDDCHSPS